MENVPPPTGVEWAARGTKRTHNQMSGREPSTSSPPPQTRRTRSPSIPSTTRADSTLSTPSHTQSASGSSSEHSQSSERFTPRREQEISELLELSRPQSFERFTPRREHEINELLELSRPPEFVRLPSFQELDARRVRRDMSRRRREDEEVALDVERARRERRNQGETQHVTIDLTSDTEEVPMPRLPGEDHHRDMGLGDGTRMFEGVRRAFAPRPERDRANQPFGQANRFPRFPAEIIDLSGDTPRGPARPAAAQQAATDLTNDDEYPHTADNPHHDPASSPEVTFLRARAISPRTFNAGTTPPVTRAPNRLNPLGNIAPIEIVDDEDDFVILRERIVPDAPQNRLERFFANVPDALRARIEADARARVFHRRAAARRGGNRGAAAAVAGGLFVPPVMDFGQVGFDMGYPPGMVEMEGEREPSPIPVLPPVAEGFTRNPVEEDVLVCPACECELSVGKLEEEVKRQVWMVKKCGHVYCGECAASRLQRSHKKGKEPKDQAPPLKKCAVPGCEAKTTGKQMVQLFL